MSSFENYTDQAETSNADNSADNHAENLERYQYLRSLSRQERDACLSKLVFVDKPKHFYVYGECIPIEGSYIINYSKLHSMLSAPTKEKFVFPDPSQFRGGDMLILGGGYRGVGSYYAIWLAKDLVDHPQELIDSYEASIADASPAIPQPEVEERIIDLNDYPLTEREWKTLAALLSTEEWYEDWEGNFNKVCSCKKLYDDINENEQLIPLILSTHGKKRKRSYAFPTLVPRDADGPHNDGNHHLYLFIHTDEMGYSAPSSMSSTPFDYFDREYHSIVVDPLLTHSLSYYGQILLQGGAFDDEYLEKIGDCDRFYEEQEDYDFENIQWIDIKDGRGLIASLYLPDNYFVDTRALFSRHLN